MSLPEMSQPLQLPSLSRSSGNPRSGRLCGPPPKMAWRDVLHGISRQQAALERPGSHARIRPSLGQDLMHSVQVLEAANVENRRALTNQFSTFTAPAGAFFVTLADCFCRYNAPYVIYFFSPFTTLAATSYIASEEKKSGKPSSGGLLSLLGRPVLRMTSHLSGAKQLCLRAAGCVVSATRNRR